jgi:hypothetical protein
VDPQRESILSFCTFGATLASRQTLPFMGPSGSGAEASVIRRASIAMQFELGVAIAAVFTIAAFIVDWPRALAGLALGAICRYLPYGTILIPIGVVIISAAAEFLYPWFGRTAEPHFWNFFIGLFAVAGSASSLYITVRNLKDRL